MDTIADGVEKDKLQTTIQQESLKFMEFYTWLEQAMKPAFFKDITHDNMVLITHSLMGFQMQDFFSIIHLKRASIVLCLDSPDADLRILKNYEMYGIKDYQVYISETPPPIAGVDAKLHVSVIYFTEAVETAEAPYPQESKEALRKLVAKRNPEMTDEEFDRLIGEMSTRFLRSQPIDRLALAFEMFNRAKTRDNCQYEVRYDLEWDETDSPSMQIVLAWKNIPKNNFLYRLARVVNRHNLVMKRFNATYIHPYETDNTLVMVLGLHGINDQAVWDTTEIVEFLREFVTVKYFAGFDNIDTHLVSTNAVTGSMGNLLRAMNAFIHQALVHVDPNLYTLDAIQDDLCRHPELTAKLCDAFDAKFNPDTLNYDTYLAIRDSLLADLAKLDTGNEDNDTRRKNVLKQGLSFIHHTLKTNFYRLNFTSLGFRLDPKFLDEIPFDRQKKFPELPFGIFFIKGMHFFGYHIRFRNTARGGLRTIIMEHSEHIASERNNVFTECYNLAYTQQMKNKDIPEGGAKGIIFVTPFLQLESEARILESELGDSGMPSEDIAKKMVIFRKEQKMEFLYQSQRSYVGSLISLVNCEANGQMRTKRIVDYWKKPEYLYLGPDENMFDPMIVWIANFSKKYGYKPGGSFISSKPRYGINHKEYGVTSLGVNVYLEAILKYMGIDPYQQEFTVKMTGGPDGDVAGNEICNLYKHYPHTAKLIALADGTGTVYEPKGLDLKTLSEMFKRGEGIRFYPPEKLTEGAFLLDKFTKRTETPLVQQTLLWTRTSGELKQIWLSSSEMNQLLRINVHKTKADVFIPGGGRPRTLNESNYKSFLDETGKPTARAIVEGANLYLTQKARRALEELGVLIIKDSSANKTGVICSSFEVLCGLALGDDVFYQNREVLIQEILERLKRCAELEADLLLSTHKKTGKYLTDISDLISARINQYTDQLLAYLESISIDDFDDDAFMRCYQSYCLPTLRQKFKHEILRNVPESHKEAIISAHVAAQTVYEKGLEWQPTIVEILPILFQDQRIMGELL